MIAPPLGPPGRAGVEHWDGDVPTVRVGRPSVVWLCGLDGWIPVRARPLGGFRALKKTPDVRREAPESFIYYTKIYMLNPLL